MKNLIVTISLAVVVAACSSNQTKDANEVASNDAGSGPKTKRVCETVRTNQTGQRLQRVCRTVPVEGS
jgi:hypothetical protein